MSAPMSKSAGFSFCHVEDRRRENREGYGHLREVQIRAQIKEE